MKREYLSRLICFVVAISLASLCSCAQNATQDKLACQDVKVSQAYFDSKAFDSKLSKTLACMPDEVTLILPKIETTASIPERLDNWLGAIDESGGNIIVESDPTASTTYGFDGGFIVGAIIDMVEVAKIVYKKLEDRALYKSAENYNTTIYYQNGTGDITKIVFTRR